MGFPKEGFAEHHQKGIAILPAEATAPLPAETILTDYARHEGISAATAKKYGATFRQIARILGYDDLRRITDDDARRFVQARMDEGRNTGTVQDDVLAAGAVFNWGVRQKRFTSNPWKDIAPKAPRRGPPPRVKYGDDEARRILTSAREESGWLRWAPWLMCFTGARIGEIAELRRGDVHTDKALQILDIVPTDARAGKNEEFQRMIPLHSALIAEGFLDYVASLPPNPDGPLFPSIKPDPHGRRDTPAQTQLGRWMRSKVKITDPKKAPAHSWRHWVKDQLRGSDAEAQDAILGHYNPRNAGAGYGKGFRGMPDKLVEVVEKIKSPLTPI